MKWSQEDQESETWLRLVRAEQPDRSEMEIRDGQRNALGRIQAHWDKALSKQAIARAINGLTFASHLAPEKPQVKPLKWHAKTGSRG